MRNTNYYGYYSKSGLWYTKDGWTNDIKGKDITNQIHCNTVKAFKRHLKNIGRKQPELKGEVFILGALDGKEIEEKVR